MEGREGQFIVMGGVVHSMGLPLFSWILRIVSAAILLQTLYFKFTGAPESIYIFTKVGAEPWGRIGSGIIELIAAILLLTPRFTWLGSVLALTVFFVSGINLFLHRTEIPILGRRLA